MSTSQTFSVPKRAKQVQEFTLHFVGGEDDRYTFVSPKKSGMLLDLLDQTDGDLGQTRAAMDFLEEGLDLGDRHLDETGPTNERMLPPGTSDEELQAHVNERPEVAWEVRQSQAERLTARLRDRHDDLDVDTIGKVIKWLVGESGARPTSRSSD